MQDWAIYSTLAFITWGFWGFFPKLATNALDPKSAFIYEAIGSILAGLAAILILRFIPAYNAKGAAFAIAGGIAAIIAEVFFMYAISKGKVSVIVPLTSLYPIISIILAVIFLHETVTLRQLLGIVCALFAIFLLAV